MSDLRRGFGEKPRERDEWEAKTRTQDDDVANDLGSWAAKTWWVAVQIYMCISHAIDDTQCAAESSSGA